MPCPRCRTRARESRRSFLPHVLDQFRQGRRRSEPQTREAPDSRPVRRQAADRAPRWIGQRDEPRAGAWDDRSPCRLARARDTRAHERPDGGRLLLQDISIRPHDEWRRRGRRVAEPPRDRRARAWPTTTRPRRTRGANAGARTDLTIVDTGQRPAHAGRSRDGQPLRNPSPAWRARVIVRTVARTMVTSRTP